MPRWTSNDLTAHLARAGFLRLAGERQGQQEAPESSLHEQIITECKRRGWIYLHGAMGSRTRRVVGEPDFVLMLDGGRTLYIEVKSKVGKLRPEQAAIAHQAAGLGHTIHVVRSMEQFLELATNHKIK